MMNTAQKIDILIIIVGVCVWWKHKCCS